MTKKHFKALAEIIAKELDLRETRVRMANRIGEICAEENPRFNWKKWYEACGV